MVALSRSYLYGLEYFLQYSQNEHVVSICKIDLWAYGLQSLECIIWHPNKIAIVGSVNCLSRYACLQIILILPRWWQQILSVFAQHTNLFSLP
jgi:hypothetical protein